MAPHIQFENGSGLTNQTRGIGHGGEIRLNANESIILKGTSSTGRSGEISTYSCESGNAGNIVLKTEKFIIKDGWRIKTSSLDVGYGGNVFITSDMIYLSGVNPH